MRPLHGTRSCYTGGCRCTSCRRANTDYIMEWNARRVGGPGAGRRVYDRVSDNFGTVSEVLWADDAGTTRCHVAWDHPTPHQSTAKVTIPSQFFMWADELTPAAVASPGGPGDGQPGEET